MNYKRCTTIIPRFSQNSKRFLLIWLYKTNYHTKENSPQLFPLFIRTEKQITIAIRLKIQTKSGHKTHRSQLLRPDFVNLKRGYPADTPQKRRFYRT